MWRGDMALLRTSKDKAGDGAAAGRLRVRFSNAPEDMEAAQRLRHAVFIAGRPGADADAGARAQGLDADAFGFRVNYLVTWGDNRRYGDEAVRAGLKKGDVFLAAAGKSDFASVDHFHAWWRLTRTVGTSVPVAILRDGKRFVLELRVLE